MKYMKVKDLFKIIKGKKVEQVYKPKENTVRFIQIDDLRNDKNIKFCERKEEYIFASKNDLIIAWDGANAGTIGYGLEGAIGSTLAILRTNSNDVFIPYLGRFLQSKSKYLRDTCTGATIPHISKKVLEEIKIPIPSYEKQIELSKILDKAQELIDKRKAQIEALDQLTQSVFLEMFGDLRTQRNGWKIVELSDVVQIDANLVDDITNYVNYPLVGIDNIEKNTGNLINIKTVGESDVKGSKYFFSKEHILYSKIRPYLNKVASPCFEGLCSTDAYPLKINNEKAKKQFILNILRSKDFVNYAVKHSKGANIPRIDQKQLLKYKIILPDLKTQNRFEYIVEKIEIQKEKMKKSLRELEYTFNSLMQRAFKGELLKNDE